MKNLKQDIEKILFTHEEIVVASKRIAKQIEEDYRNSEKEPVLLCTLKGAIPFFAELIKHIDIHLVMDVIDVASYHGGTSSSGKIVLRRDVIMNLEDRDVIIVEDIVDTGRTLKHLIEYLKSKKAKSVVCASLVDKPDARVVDVQADYVGIESPNAFLVGFGLDYKEKYRNLSYIGILKPEIYS